MKRNYSKIRMRLADAIVRELAREEGCWPEVKKKVRGLLGSDVRRLDELYQLADTAAAAVLDCDRIKVTARRNAITP